MTSQVDYRQLCRLCASYDDNKLDIFSDIGRARNLIGKITSCLDFEVSYFFRFLPKYAIFPSHD